MKKALFALLFLSSGILFAQVDSTKGPTITYSKVGFEQSENDREVYNLLKVDPLQLAFGEMIFHYERRFGERFSVDVGLGPTSMDYVYQFIQAANENLSSGTGDRSAQFGITTSLALKYYPSNYTKALDEFYFGPEISYKHYNNTVRNCSINDNAILDEHRTLIEAQIVGGYIFYLTDRVVFDLYGGFGLKQRNIDRYSCDFAGPVQSSTLNQINDVVPGFSTGIRLGFGF